MTIAEIRQIEEARDGQMNVAHLIKEGSFYHANDWSAWLMSKFPIGEAKRKPMAVTANKLKDDYLHVFVGFPATSIGKYVPQEEIIEFKPINDTQIDVVLNVDFGGASIEDIRKMVDEWKETLPLKQGKKQGREDNSVTKEAPRIIRITDIIARVVSLPMEDISPKQAYDILRDLRRDISAIF